MAERSALKRGHPCGSVSDVELALHRSHALDGSHGVEHVIELIGERDSAQRHPVVLRKYLDAARVLDLFVELRRDPRGKPMILAPLAEIAPIGITAVVQKHSKRRPDSETGKQTRMFSVHVHHFRSPR